MHARLLYFYSSMLPFSFLSDFVFFYPFYNLMFRHYGLSNFGIAMLLILMQASKMLSDLPSGLIADKCGRRNLFILAQLLRIIALFLWFLVPNKITFLIGVIFLGISMSCFYGNLEAYVYDELKVHAMHGYFSKFMSKYYAIQNIAITLATFLSGYLFHAGSFRAVFLCSIISIFFSIFCIFAMPNCDYEQKVELEDKNAVNELSLKSSLRFFFSNKSMMFFACLAAMSDGMFIFMIDLSTLIMGDMQISGKNMAIIISFVGCIRIFSNLFSGYTVAFFSIPRVIFCLIGTGLLLGIVSHRYNFYLIIVVMSFMVLYSFLDLSIKTRMQSCITSNMRATMMSISSFLISVVAIFLNAVNGLMTKYHPYSQSILCIGIIICIIAIVLLLVYYRKHDIIAHNVY